MSCGAAVVSPARSGPFPKSLGTADALLVDGGLPGCAIAAAMNRFPAWRMRIFTGWRTAAAANGFVPKPSFPWTGAGGSWGKPFEIF